MIVSVMVALVSILPFVIPALFILNTKNPYMALFGLTTIPSIGLGYILYGFMDRMVDALYGRSSNSKSESGDV
jgi:hypothetical protein